MAKVDPDVDAGWAPVLKQLPTLIIPFIGMRTMTRQRSGLQATRLLWLVFVNASLLIWIPVIALGSTDDAPVSMAVGAAVAAVVGVALTLVALRFAPVLDGSSPAALAGSFQRATLIRIACAQGAAIVGFVCFLLTGSWVVYAVGFAFAAWGMWQAAPRAATLDRGQRAIADAGSDLRLVRVLNTTSLTR